MRVGDRVAATRAETLAADPAPPRPLAGGGGAGGGRDDGAGRTGAAAAAVGGLLVAWKRAPADEELARAERRIRQLRGRLIRLEPSPFRAGGPRSGGRGEGRRDPGPVPTRPGRAGGAARCRGVAMRIAVVSDIHSNLRRWRRCWRTRQVDAIWHLGDTVGYGPEPQAVVDRLREAGAIGVRGNHDDAAGGGSSIEFFNPDGTRPWSGHAADRRADEALPGGPSGAPRARGIGLHPCPRQPKRSHLGVPGLAGGRRANLSAFETRVLPRRPYPRAARLPRIRGRMRAGPRSRSSRLARRAAPDPQPGQRGPAPRRRSLDPATC
jgi:hypothetical protein